MIIEATMPTIITMPVVSELTFRRVPMHRHACLYSP